jgi:hypothetical protein
LIKRLLKNKKGTAEVIGSVMFIVILLFFFTNVYLWHDAAVKEMNDFYGEKINSPISIKAYDSVNHALVIENSGGADAIISSYWIDERASTSGAPDVKHQLFDVLPLHYVVKAGGTPLSIPLSYNPAGHGTFRVITTIGNYALFDF